MFPIIGIVVVIGAILGGYLFEHGNLAVLVQPAELIIIGGAAVGTLLIANPMPVIVSVLQGVLSTIKATKYSKAYYLTTLRMLNDLFKRARRRGGLTSLESDVEEPENSEIFKNYPEILKDHHVIGLFPTRWHCHVGADFSFRPGPNGRARP